MIAEVPQLSFRWALNQQGNVALFPWYLGSKFRKQTSFSVQALVMTLLVMTLLACYDSACITSTNVLWTKRSHMAKPRVSVRGHGQKHGHRKDEQIGTGTAVSAQK